MIKRLTSVITVLIFCILLVSSTVFKNTTADALLGNTASASSQKETVFNSAADSEFIEKFMTDFAGESSLYIDRTPGTQEGKNAAEFLLGEARNYGMDYELQEFDSEATEGKKSYNAIARYISINPNAKRVIIGAHFDNSYSLEYYSNPLKAAGAYNNATGVAALLALIKLFSEKRPAFDFTVEFVFFGEQLPSLQGARQYIDKYCADSNNILLAVIFQGVGGGADNYLYCDDVNTTHEDWLNGKIKESGSNIKAAPDNKRTFLSPTLIGPYTHYGLQNESQAFLNASVNTAAFLGLDWNASNYYGMVESTQYTSITDTENDTLENLKKYYPTYATKIAGTVETVAYILSQSDFIETMIYSRENKFDYSLLNNGLFSLVLQAVILAVVFGGAVLLAGYYKKKHPKPVITIITKEFLEQPSVFGNEYENDDILNDIKKEYQKQKNDNTPFDGY